MTTKRKSAFQVVRWAKLMLGRFPAHQKTKKARGQRFTLKPLNVYLSQEPPTFCFNVLQGDSNSNYEFWPPKPIICTPGGIQTGLWGSNAEDWVLYSIIVSFCSTWQLDSDPSGHTDCILNVVLSHSMFMCVCVCVAIERKIKKFSVEMWASDEIYPIAWHHLMEAVYSVEQQGTAMRGKQSLFW